MIETAMILAAGLGTRMRPLTDDRPKPLIEVSGKALIDHVLDCLTSGGVKRVVVNLHYRADQLHDHLEQYTGLEIMLSDETDQLLDSGGGVKKALSLLGPKPFFTVNSDSLWIKGVRGIFESLSGSFDAKQMGALMLVAGTNDCTGYDGRGDFYLDSEGRLSWRAESQIAPFVWTGAQIFTPAAFEDTPDGPFSMRLIWDRMIEAGNLYGLRHDGRWLHVGTPEAILEAEAALQQL